MRELVTGRDAEADRLDVTGAELEVDAVIGVLATGLSNKAIARRLGISESTVKVHIRAIMAATGVSNRTQLVARFLAAG